MSTSDNTAQDKRDVYRKVTDQIVTAIENGAGNWKMPWHTDGRFAFSPINVTSKKTVSRNQYSLPLGRCSGKVLRLRRMGDIPAVARARCTSAEG